jgi:tagatose 6-phosphate kinase
MIVVVNLNPSLDKIYTMPSLPYGQASRAETVQNTAGGKGTHVAHVITALGEECTVVGFLGGYVGEFIAQDLRDRNIQNCCTRIVGETRSCINVATSDGKQTEILEPGPVIEEAEQEAFFQTYIKCIKTADVIVASGSLPRGVGSDFYKKLIAVAKTTKKPFLLDTSGEALQQGILARPHFIKPNQDEMAVLCNHSIESLQDAVRELQHLTQEGILMPAVSLGKAGSVVAYKGHIYHAQPQQADKVINAVGSGDAYVAGLAVGLQRHLAIEDILRLASACGTANVLEAESGCVDPMQVRTIYKNVQVKIIA